MNNENEKLNKEMTVSESIFAKIKADRISPTSKLHFKMIRSALWLPGILITLLGAFAVAGIIFGETHAGWEYRQFINHSPLSLIAQALPIVWLLSFIIFAGLIVKALRLTNGGYKYSVNMILLSSLSISIILGGLIFVIDMEVKENDLLRYPTHKIQTNLWSQPKVGRILGQINIQDDGIIILTDTMNKNWVLDTSELISDDEIYDKQMVRLIGQQVDDANFIACLMFPWEFDRHEMIEANNEIRKHNFETTRDDTNRCNGILNMLRLQMQ